MVGLLVLVWFYEEGLECVITDFNAQTFPRLFHTLSCSVRIILHDPVAMTSAF